MDYRDPASEEAQEELEDAIDRIAEGTALAVGLIIADRVASVRDGLTHAQAYALMPDDMERMQREMDKGYKAVAQVVEQSYTSMAAHNDTWASIYYRHASVAQVPASRHPQMAAALSKGIEAAKESARVLFNTSVVGIVDTNGEIHGLRSAYKAIVGESIAKVAVGEATFQNGVLEATRTLADSGLRVLYASGHTRSLYSAVRLNVMDGYRSTMADLRLIQGKEFGADGVEVSAHVPCAADHDAYQGRQFKREAFANLQASLSRQLVYGPNCRHMVSPIIVGISKSAYSDSELKSMRDRSREQVTFTGTSGKQLTKSRYDASQYQRSLETQIRKLNNERVLLEREDMPVGEVKERITRYTQVYKTMSAQAKLTTRMERTQAYLLK